MKKFAVILAGCGVYDGAEIHEAVITLLAIEKNGAEYEIFAPDVPQHHVINHLTGQAMNETRNVLVESARIARGKIKPLDRFHPDDFDCLIFPGGFGVAKNLCTWAFEGELCTVNPGVEKAIRAMVQAGKPVGALCISPVILARLFPGTLVTVGDDKPVIESIEKMGGIHKTTTHGDVIVDEANHFFTTPCYMLDAKISDIWTGADNIVRAMIA
jgi:enhancing lycopene biosynthesis protein 2